MAASQSSPKRKAIRILPAARDDKSVQQVANELFTLTVDYAKQEIRDPLKGLGGYVLWGAAAMLLSGFGVVLLAIGLLRALQTQTGSTFTGSLSFAPYFIVLLAAVSILGGAVAMIQRKK